MDVEFVNRYTVSREGQKAFHIDPTRRRAERSPMPRPTGGGRRGSVIRMSGLVLAVGILIIALVSQMWVFFILGLILALIYTMRIVQTRNETDTADQRQARRMEELIAIQQAPKWIRFIRFGDFVESEDPSSWKQYKYSQITRITQDSAYITLWMDDETQVRVYKKGFIIGTLEGFEPFIEKKAHLAGIPELAAEKEEAAEGLQGSEAGEKQLAAEKLRQNPVLHAAEEPESGEAAVQNPQQDNENIDEGTIQ